MMFLKADLHRTRVDWTRCLHVEEHLPILNEAHPSVKRFLDNEIFTALKWRERGKRVRHCSSMESCSCRFRQCHVFLPCRHIIYSDMCVPPNQEGKVLSDERQRDILTNIQHLPPVIDLQSRPQEPTRPVASPSRAPRFIGSSKALLEQAMNYCFRLNQNNVDTENRVEALENALQILSRTVSDLEDLVLE